MKLEAVWNDALFMFSFISPINKNSCHGRSPKHEQAEWSKQDRDTQLWEDEQGCKILLSHFRFALSLKAQAPNLRMLMDMALLLVQKKETS